MTKPFAWSWSVLTSFETCPWRHFKTKVEKSVIEAQSDEMAWGNKVHKSFENRVLHGTPFPLNMPGNYENIAARVIASSAGGEIEAEQKMGLTRDYEPCGFFAKDVWVRVITDATVTKGGKAVVLDYKTGKVSKTTAQLKLTAAATFHVKPEVNSITTGYLWLADGTIASETYTRAQLPEIWQEFAPRVTRLERALESQNFPKNPSGLCRAWCPVKTCEHNGNYTGK